MDETLVEIVEVLELNGKKARVLLLNSPFYPSGGGQPGDTGYLLGERFRAEVLDAGKHGDGVALTLTLTEGQPAVGMKLTAEVDVARHAILSRMHSAQHLFSRLQENDHEGLETLKVYINTEESVIYIHYDGALSWDSLFETEEKTREAIIADLPVESLNASRDDAEKIPELKAKWERIHDEQIRVVQIKGVDATACSGTHVSHTGEIGGFLITGFNGSAPDWEVRYTVFAEERVREYSRVMRRLLREVGCRPNQIEGVFARQKDENAELRHFMGKMRDYIAIPWEIRAAAGHPLYLAVLPGLTKDMVSARARECVAEHPEAFCLALMPDAASSGSFPFILLRGAEISADLSVFVKNFQKLEARGGGKSDWINGTTTQKSTSVWIECLNAMK